MQPHTQKHNIGLYDLNGKGVHTGSGLHRSGLVSILFNTSMKYSWFILKNIYFCSWNNIDWLLQE